MITRGNSIEQIKRILVRCSNFPRFGSLNVVSGDTLDYLLFNYLKERNLLTEEQQKYYKYRSSYWRTKYASTKPSSGVFLNTASLQAMAEVVDKYFI